MNDMTKFNYSLLPTNFQQEDIEYLEHCATDIEVGGRIAIEGIMRIGKRLNDARSKFGENDKAFGQWRKGRLPWLEYQTALNFMRVHSKFGKENLLYNNYRVENLAPSILYALAAPSTPDSVIDKAVAKAEAGEKVTVSDVKDWKALEAELEAERKAREIAEQRCREFGQESNERRIKIRELTQQIDLLKAQPAPGPVTIEKIVAPDDYETAKATAEKLKADIAAMRKRQDELVQQQVAAKLRERERELDALERQAKQAEIRLQSLNKQIDSYSSIERMTRLQRDQIEKCRSMLAELAANMEGFDWLENDPKTDQLWDALAGMMRNAAIAIDMFCGRAPNTGTHRKVNCD